MKTARRWWIPVLAACVAAGSARAADWHVATNGNDAADGTTWATAKQTIQAAVDAAATNDTVWVSNGVYATGGRTAGALTNRVVIDRPITVRSVNGFAVTMILGAADPAEADRLGAASVRCVYVASNAILMGFTLTNGATTEAHGTYGGRGGGALCEDSGKLVDCLLIGNSAEVGGGSSGGTLHNCLVTGNWAKSSGGGILAGTLNNCTVSGNAANSFGGGARLGALNNCIVAGNTAPANPEHTNSTFNHSCTSPDPGGTGNITNDPQFADAAAGDYHLRTNSPCFDAGNNTWAQGTIDLDGNPRIVNGTVDMGAFELQTALMIDPANTNLSNAAANGLAIDVTASVPWTAVTNAPWLAITSGDSGATNGTVFFGMASNGLATSRTGAVIVAGGGLSFTCMVVQAGSPVLEIYPASSNVSSDAVSGMIIDVTANLPWTATPNMPWLAIISGESGTTNGAVVFSVASNGLPVSRTGAVVFTGGGIARTCMVVQAAGNAFLSGWHVATNGNDTADGTAWTSAKLTIQAAVDAATNGGTVWVSNGVYAGLVTVNKGIAVRSVNGAEATTIQGSSSRCVNMNHADAVISGFTLTGGTADWGGGAYIDAGALERCIIRNNTATGRTGYDDPDHPDRFSIATHGGGVYGGTLRDCRVVSNTASAGDFARLGVAASGGGTYQAHLINCLVWGNTAIAYNGELAPCGAYGGGTRAGINENCTVVGNSVSAATATGGGAVCGGGCYDSANLNSIVWYNAVGDIDGGACTFTCASNAPGGAGNFASEPVFINRFTGNWRLISNSPCVDAGTNQPWMSEAADLDGNPRVAGGRADLGAYEVQPGGEPAGGWFVATNGSDAAAGANWATAKLTIQAGIDASAPGDTIWVSNGVYATGGGRAVVGTRANRVAIDQAVTVRSVNGPETTAIVGGGMRCAYVVDGAVLSGFTLTNGSTAGGECGPSLPACGTDHNGGGAFCEDTGMLTNCVLAGNSAANEGGGSAGGILNNCRLTGNSSGYNGGGSAGGILNQCVLTSNSTSYVGGGADGGTLNNCLLTGNHASYGAGAGFSTLNNCTVAGNLGWDGGGAIWSTLKNCIVYGNTGDEDKANYRECTFTNSCTTPAPGGTGNITNDPQFADAAAGNYHLISGSPCRDAGNNAYVQGTADLDGNPRIVNGTVDMGAYEAEALVSFEAWAAAITNGLTNATDCATGDGVPNLLKYATGSSPTEPDGLALLGWVNGSPTLRFNRNPNATDITLVVQGAEAISNGAAWRGLATNIGGSWGGAANVDESGSGNPVVCTIEDLVPLLTNRFLRLKVTRP